VRAAGLIRVRLVLVRGFQIPMSAAPPSVPVLIGALDRLRDQLV